MQLNPLLDGVRVIDLSRILPGPFCTLYLAQMGAEVIKVEEPAGGDYGRSLAPEVFAMVNRGKKSVTLDLRRQEDAERLRQLIRGADVLIESFRPGVMERFGCGYEQLRELNPRLVYAALTGYGHTGPYRDRPGHDMNYRGYAGELEQTCASGIAPAPGNFQVADLAGGALTCAIGILGAIIGARASGAGSFVDVAMLDGTLALQVAALGALRGNGQSPGRGRDLLSGGTPNYQVYECADGRHLAVGSLEPKFFEEFCRATGHPDLMRLAFGKQRDHQLLREQLAALIRSRKCDEWEALLAPLDTCVSAVLTPAEALTNEQVRARGMIVDDGGKPAYNFPIRFVGAQLPDPSSPSPKLGEHNDELLGQAGPSDSLPGALPC